MLARSAVSLLRPASSAACRPAAPLSTSAPRCEIRKLARLRVVDNSQIGKEAMAEGRPPRVIHVYNKRAVATVGDKVLMAIRGQKRKGLLVGCVKTQHPMSMIPKFDTNNVVLIDDAGTPLGTRIHVPIPNVIRERLQRMSHKKSGDFTKILSLATRFV
ncbi:39S ribosomal protein L14, mitochondrial [Amphibalanus amphitrite]|uniref:Large ribosomal subunit protein uL14m n=1 Tax=Amphibalanus amphitrite TaxID=1232801 RepID=A0A6A4X6A0_AMPAM|nr:39S ribosomal protein L14, mitochondrial [Amphibalanus amphitrite]